MEIIFTLDMLYNIDEMEKCKAVVECRCYTDICMLNIFILSKDYFNQKKRKNCARLINEII